LREDLESWIRGKTTQSAGAVEVAEITAEAEAEVAVETEAAIEAELNVIDLERLIDPYLTEAEELPDTGEEFISDTLIETADEKTILETQTEIVEEEMEESKIAADEVTAEEISAERLFGDDLEKAVIVPEPAHEPSVMFDINEKDNDEDNDVNDDSDSEEQSARGTFEEIASRMERQRNANGTWNASNMYEFEQDEIRKNQRRFVTLCVLAIIVIGAATALYRYMHRSSYDVMMSGAHDLYEQRQYPQAFEAYNKASQRYPGRVEPILGTAHAAGRIGRVGDAIAAYRLCLERFPADAADLRSNVFYETGLLHVTLKAWDKAQESFEAAIAANAENYGAYFSLGDSLEAQNQVDKAILAYKQALDLNPSSDAAREAVKRTSLILSSIEKIDNDAVLMRKYEQALISGDVALVDERFREASNYFAEAIAIHSDDVRAWVGFGEARFKLGDTVGAVKYLERALEREPENERAKSRLAEIEAASRRSAPQRQSNTGSSPRSSVNNAPKAPVASAAAGRETLFNSGVELYQEGEYAKAFDAFIACLRSPERGLLSSAPLAGAPGPMWKGSQVSLSVPSDARLLAEAVRLNPMDRDLYVNISMAGMKMGIDREAMREALNEAVSHARLRTNNL